MNTMSPTGARRWIRVVLVALVLSSVITGSVVYYQNGKERQRAGKLMTLQEALWVAERDLSHVYPPGTPESRGVAQALANENASLAEQKFESLILYRRGLTDTDQATEPLLVFGFDPNTISHAKKEHAE